MTPLTASSHHAAVGKPRFRHRITVVPAPLKPCATPSIMPKSPTRRPTRRQTFDRHPRSVADSDGQRINYAARRPSKSP